MPKFDQARPISDIKQGDSDLYAVDGTGQILQKRIKFGRGGSVESTTWVPLEAGHCQAPSDEYLRDLERLDDDPRLVASDPHKRWGGNPEERG